MRNYVIKEFGILAFGMMGVTMLSMVAANMLNTPDTLTCLFGMVLGIGTFAGTIAWCFRLCRVFSNLMEMSSIEESTTKEGNSK